MNTQEIIKAIERLTNLLLKEHGENNTKLVSINVGGIASTSKPTAVNNGSKVNAYFDQYGRIHVYDDGGGGVGGGGQMTYVLDTINSKGHGLITPVNGTSTFTCSAYSFTINPKTIIKIDHWNSSDVFIGTYDPKQYVITESSGTITVTGVTFSTGDSIVMWVEGAERTTDLSYDSVKVVVQNPINYTFVREKTVSETNLSADRYFAAVYMDSYNTLDIKAYITDSASAQLKVYRTQDINATIPTTGGTAGSEWYEVTTEIFGGALSGTTINQDKVNIKGMPYAYLIEYTTGSATNSVNVWTNKYYS